LLIDVCRSQQCARGEEPHSAAWQRDALPRTSPKKTVA
jgi:hypothetical protein